jgi:uncharacterized membrane protein YcjF (UPF0283 family)
MASFCILCGTKIAEDPSSDANLEATMCSNCFRQFSTFQPSTSQQQQQQQEEEGQLRGGGGQAEKQSIPEVMASPTLYPRLQGHDLESLNSRLRSLWRRMLEALALLFGFALVGFAGLELGTTIAELFGYSDISIFSLPIIALCEIIFILAILGEYGSIRFWK